MPEFQTIYRLGRRPGEGVFCDAKGLSVGDVALLERAPEGDGRRWRPRSTADINRELSRCYGLPVEIEPKSGGLTTLAQALERGDLAHAQMVALHLGFPDPPDLQKLAGDVEALADLARRLEASGLLKGGWNPDRHPRWPSGSQNSVGGQFALGDSPGAGGAANLETGDNRSGFVSAAVRTYSPTQQAANLALSQSYLAIPRVRAFLSVLASRESAGKYNAIVGGGTFSEYSRHPNRYVRALNSISAGAFQFNYKTWKEKSSALGLTDFSRRSQQLAAAYQLGLLGAIVDLENGNVSGAIFKAGKRWDAFPLDATGRSLSGGVRLLQPIINAYKAALNLPSKL